MSARPILGWSTDDVRTRVPITYPGDAHLLNVAPTGSGKTRARVLPNLARYEGSVFVTDWNNELTKETSLYRQFVIGQRQRVFDPLKVVDRKFMPREADGTLSYGRVNPIDFIIASTSPFTAALSIAEALIPHGTTKEQHWSDSAQLLLAAWFLFVAFDPALDEMEQAKPGSGRRNMATVWRMLSSVDQEKEALAGMQESSNLFVADQARAVLEASDDNREMQSIRHHIRVNCSKTFSEPGILDSLSETNIDFAEMNRTPMSVYVVLPGWAMRTQYTYVRLLLSMALGGIERGGRRSFDSKVPPILFVLEEFPALRNAEFIVDALARMRAFGVKCDIYAQALSQLRDLYKDAWGTILGNCGVVQSFGGTNDVFGAETISKLAGEKTEVARSISDPHKPGDRGGQSYSLFGRALFLPDQIMRFPKGQSLVCHAGENPSVISLIKPSLLDTCPDLVAFNQAIGAGYTPDQAATHARKAYADFKAWEATQRQPPAAPQQKKKKFGLF